MGRWTWVFGMFVLFANAAVFWLRGRPAVQQNPNLASGYRRLIIGFLGWGMIPLLVMALGSTLGRVPSVLHYLRPASGNPWALAFTASVIFIWAAGTYWLVWRGGAVTLIEYPGLLGEHVRTPGAVIMLWIVCVAGGIAGLVAILA